MNVTLNQKQIVFPVSVVNANDRENAFPYRSLNSLARKKKPFDESRVFRAVSSLEDKPGCMKGMKATRN